MKILVDENMPYARELFSRLGEVKAVPGRPIPVAELDDADALMVRSVTKVNEALLGGNPSNLSAPQPPEPIMWMRRGLSRLAWGFQRRLAAMLSLLLNMFFRFTDAGGA